MTSRVCAPQTPLGALIRGVLAGAVGTVAMDLLWFYRYKRGGGESGFLDWEFSAGLDDWSKAPAPAQVGRRLFEGFFQRDLSPRWAVLTNNVMHWMYGLGWGGVYGILAGSVRLPRVRSGLLFGTIVWTMDYVVLPLAKVYKPMWEYDLPTLAKDLSAHLVYGAGTSVVFKARILNRAIRRRW
ncbi:MAG: hypothetical protein E6I52_28565 [Chloroflexi bacterium]|nr:MAG: hypothetical protein E6I52_28565 [Chloroflexota bacterium]